MRIFAIVMLVGCTAVNAPVASVGDDGVPTQMAPRPMTTALPTQFSEWQTMAMHRGWVMALEESPEHAPSVEWHDDTCADGTPHRIATPSGGCEIGLAAEDRILLAKPADGTFPKQVFMHELLHVYIWTHGLTDAPLHTNSIWALERIVAGMMTDDGILGVDGNPAPSPAPVPVPGPGASTGQRSMVVPCGQPLQACCDQIGTPCDGGLACNFVEQVGFRCVLAQ